MIFNTQRTCWSLGVAFATVFSLLLTSIAGAAEFVGPTEAPIGIQQLSITYSGGTALFDVRFDERSFDDVYDTGSSGLPFTSEADIAVAFDAVADLLNTVATEYSGVESAPTFDGVRNYRLRYPSTYDATDVTRFFELGKAPYDWRLRNFYDSPVLPRNQSFPELGAPNYTWVTFTPVANQPAELIRMVTVTHPGNPGDAGNVGFGSVDHVYDIGQFEITAAQYTTFLNAVATDDTYGLYNPDMWNEERGCKIQRFGSVGHYTYDVASDYADRPVNFVSWGDAARFCNWLHNNQPSGPQDALTTEDGSYELDGAIIDEDLIAITRKANATWVLPSEDEWYKAAYNHNDGASGNYWIFPTQTNTLPTLEAPPGTDLVNGSLNIGGVMEVGAPYYRTEIGAYYSKPSASPYFTYDQGGNVSEWTEGIVTNMFGQYRVSRGGAFSNPSNDARSTNRNAFTATTEWDVFGLRVARLRNDLSPCAGEPEHLGTLITAGEANKVAAANGRAYIANGSAGLAIVNAIDPTTPAVLGTFENLDNAFDVFVEGNIAYVTDEDAGLVILNVNSAPSPSLVGFLDTQGKAYGVTVKDSKAYVAAFHHGLHIADVSDPANPTLLGTYDANGYSVDVAVEGNVAYMATLTDGLQILDVTDPQNIAVLGALDTPGQAAGIALKSNIAFVADGKSGLQIIDVSNPANPTLLSTYATTSAAVDVIIEGDIAYVPNGEDGLQVIDISDPANPTLINSYHAPGIATGVDVVGSTVYTANYESGLAIVELPHQPFELAGSYDTMDPAQQIAVQGTTAYIVGFESELHFVDVTDPTAPASISSFALPTQGTGLAVSGDIAYVGDEDEGLYIVDVSDPLSPQVLANFPAGFDIEDVLVAGPTVYLIESARLRTLDVSDPANPTLIGSLFFGGPDASARGGALSGSTVYLAARAAGLMIFDVSDLANPTLVGSFDAIVDAFDVAVVGNVAYVTDLDGDALWIIDVSDTVNPTMLGKYDLPTRGLAVNAIGTTVYVSDTLSRLYMIDASDPTAPYALATHKLVEDVQDIAVLGTTVYVANEFDGLQIFDATNECEAVCESDLNRDGSSDDIDYTIMANCMLGPVNSLSSGCGTADLDADGDVDLADYAEMQSTFGCSE